MPWFRVDDSLDMHPKTLAAGNEAIGLWARCGAYAARHLTDGFIPREIALLYGSEALAEVLVAAKLWRRTKGGYRMHDYLGYNPSREAVENQRRSNADRQSRWRERSGRRDRNGVSNGVSNSAPSHPIPDTPQPPAPDGAGGHRGQHDNCRSCGTNPRGKPPPSEASRHPSARPLSEAIAAATPREDTP